MNFCSQTITFKKDNEDYNIVDCSSQCEIDQEEITDTSSPECSGKKYPISTLEFSSSNKKKFSVKRKLLLQKPTLDIHPRNRNFLVKSEGHFQRIKRKKLLTYESNVLHENHVKKSAQNNDLNGRVHCGVSFAPELEECIYNPTRAALTAGLIKSPSPEIFSEEDSRGKSELFSLKDHIICSQDSSGNISFEDEEQFSVQAHCRTSNLIDSIGHEGNFDVSDIKEEIICSQDSLDIPLKNNKCIVESTKLNELLGSTKKLQEEGHEGNLDVSEIKEEIICSQDSLDLLLKNNKCIVENYENSTKLNELLDPSKILQEEAHEGALDVSDIKEEIICSQDSLLDISIKNNKCIIESAKFNELLGSSKVLQEKDEEDKISKSAAHKEEIICSQDYDNQPYQNYEKNGIFKEYSSPKILLYNEDHKDDSDFDRSKEDIIYSQDSDVNITRIESNIFSNACEKPNISRSPTNFLIDEGKQEENINFGDSEIDDSSERDPCLTFASSTDSLLLKTEATRYSKESKQKYNGSIGSPVSSNHISQTEVDEPHSEFLVKAPKKGTLLQRAYHVLSDLKKEANLLSYEIKVGLRASKGLFVSEPLIIQNIYYEQKNYIISCKPQNSEEINNQHHTKGSIYLIVSNLTMDMRTNSVIVIHFPLVALLGLPVMRVILFAENRIQVISSTRVTASIDISLPNLIIGPGDQKIMRVIKKKNSKTVMDVIIVQLFGKLCSLELKLLHISKQRIATHTAIELLTVDSENQFCLVKDSESILLKDINLEVNNSYIFFGFTLMCSRVKNEVRSAAEYYSSLKFTNNFIYVVEPCINSWKINHLSKTPANTRHYTSLSSVCSRNHERFEFLLKEYNVLENKILVRDESFSEITELHFEEQCLEHKIKLISLSMPVVLSGIYFLNDEVHWFKNYHRKK